MIGKRLRTCCMICMTIIFLLVTAIGIWKQPIKSLALSKSANNIAEQIAEITIDRWNWYGRLPSVAIGQAFVESGLGAGGNLFGVNGHAGRGVYSSTIGYLECLRNQYFRGEGSFSLSPEYQLAVIMKGGRYCAGESAYGSYYNNVLNSIDRYGWRRYDRPIRKRIQAEKAKKLRQKRQRKPFHVIFSDKLCPGTCKVDPGWIKKGSTIVFSGGIVEAVSTKRGLKNTIICGCERVIFPQTVDGSDFFDLEKLRIHIDVFENVKG